MREDLERQLVQDFPRTFFREQPRSMEPFAMFGIECGDGWYTLLREGAEKLEPIFVDLIAKDPEGFKYGYYRTSQIKEKYGTLRWYLAGSSEEMDKIIDEAEEKSAVTCEQCGKAGKLRGYGWYYTACVEHAEEQDRDNLEFLEWKHDQNLKEKTSEKSH